MMVPEKGGTCTLTPPHPRVGGNTLTVEHVLAWGAALTLLPALHGVLEGLVTYSPLRKSRSVLVLSDLSLPDSELYTGAD